ncbi:hypothetical protein NM688_g4921 [Phlebia brevispora]|uniref:Uncharacterized protein n=1 Tax=Phlebia brevispora TaxID=194682 RepID=A0ACC1T1A3_9APHY|nr:hypothetical protein NM688_g4921 [Phlebia brevispora]
MTSRPRPPVEYDFAFETVTGFFLQDSDSTDPNTFDVISSDFGLVSSAAPLHWQAFEWTISELNRVAPKDVSYRVLYIARHGEGYHNVAESIYGSVTWDDYWSKINSDGNITWGPDAELTLLGIAQARSLSSAWRFQAEAGVPLPQSFYVSPLTRALDTLNATWGDWVLTRPDIPAPVVIEGLRETIGVHTCDMRRSKTFIAHRYPSWSFEEGFAEADPFWTPDTRETADAQQARARRALVEILGQDDATCRSFLSTLVLSLSLFSVATADKHISRRHHALNRLERDHTAGKRFDSARMTYYEAGLGACGQTNSDSDFIVALNSAQYDGGSHCFETITISYNGKSTSAQITDECPGCPYGGLDLTPGLFSFFSSEDAGVIYGEWDFGSGGGAADSPSPTPTPTPTPPPPPPTTTWKPTSTWSPLPLPTTTSTKHTTSTPPPPPTTSSTSTTPSSSAAPSSSSVASSSAVASSSSVASSSVASSSSAASSTASASATSSGASASATASSSSAAPVPTSAGGINSLNQAFAQMAALDAAGASAQ